jgi:hypothetical protein
MIKKLLALFVVFEAVSMTVNAAPAPLPSTFIQNITLLLSVVEQGKTASNFSSAAVVTATITTQQAIEAFGEATSNRFSAAAQLLTMSPITYYTNPVVTTVGGRSFTNNYIYGYPGNPNFVIKDGANVVDINQYFTVTTLSSNTPVSSYQVNKTGGYVAYKNYRIRMISVSNAALAFSGTGFVVTPLVNVPVRPGVVVVGYNDDWTSLVGIADNGVANGVLRGTISATFEKLE